MKLDILLTKNYGDFIKNNYSEFTLVDNRLNATGNSIINILIMVGAFGVVITIMYACLKLMLGNSAEKSEAKKHLIIEIILGVLLFGIVSFVLILFRYVANIKL